jgi:Tol biopolymer transport system component
VDVADSVEKQFTWFDRKGNELEKVGNPIDSMDPLAPSLSPDGKTVAFVRTVNGNGDIWLLDTTSGALSQFTDHPARDVFPVFSADGAWIGFSSNRRGGFELHRKELRSKKPEDLVIRAQLAPTTPEAWSRDALFFHRGYHDLMAARADGSVVQLARGSANSTLGHSQISPDGAWLALPSNRSGRMEIHVARLSTSTFQILPPVSVGGGEWPRWSRDGKELFYVAPDGMLMAVPFNPSNGRSGQPEKLFAPPMANSFRQAIYYSQYMVAPDGRFLVVCIQKTQSPIHVIDYGPPRGIR